MHVPQAVQSWRRHATSDIAPSSDVLAQSAHGIARSAVDLALALRVAARAGLIRGDAETVAVAHLHQAAQAWLTVRDAWAGITTAVAADATETVAATRLRDAATGLRTALAEAPRGREELVAPLAAARSGYAQHVELATTQNLLVQRLGSAGHLYVPARDLPPAPDRVEAAIRSRQVSAPSERAALLTQPYSAALTHAARARTVVDKPPRRPAPRRPATAPGPAGGPRATHDAARPLRDTASFLEL